jgi:molybdopterin/thiamine biosynthesis adenylyltransferase
MARPEQPARRVLLIGAGGLGCAVGRVLARSAAFLPGLTLTVVDDDLVSADNLHRQLFYGLEDVGRTKAPLLAERFEEMAAVAGGRARVEALVGRFVPSNARELVRAHDLVIEGADNFATKFLACDAARLERRPVVHGGVVRWAGYALASGPEGAPCYRCLFEDLPREQPDTCAISGVVGPMVGVVGALQARLAIGALLGRPGELGRMVHADALRGGPLRVRPLRRRDTCPLCGSAAPILDVEPARYIQSCAA